MTNVILLAAQSGNKLKKLGSTNGGEFAGPCPACGGKDRFRVWPNHPKFKDKGGYFWCRQCETKGDGIEFARKFLNMSFSEACEQVGYQPPHQPARARHCIAPIPPHSTGPEDWQPDELAQPDVNFTYTMEGYLDHVFVDPDDEQMKDYLSRGIKEHTVKGFGLRYNPEPIRLFPHQVGAKDMEDGKMVYIPEGMVIPVRREHQLYNVKVRRTTPQANDHYPKYMGVKGGRNVCSIFSHSPDDMPIIIVESEFDALLLAQEAGRIVCPVSLGCCQNKPDADLDKLLLRAPRILVALDADDAGKKAAQWWCNTYPNAHICPIPNGHKDPGEYFLAGGDLFQWVRLALLKSRYFVVDRRPDMRTTELRLSSPSTADSRYCDVKETAYYQIPDEYIPYLPDGFENGRWITPPDGKGYYVVVTTTKPRALSKVLEHFPESERADATIRLKASFDLKPGNPFLSFESYDYYGCFN